MHRLFYGYAGSDTNAGECIRAASLAISEFVSVEASQTWEDLQVDGKLIISDIEAAIEHCNLGVFDVTSLNNNVLFELGIAIGLGKSVVITRESDNQNTDRIFREFSLLTSTGYTGYINSGELVSRVSRVLSQPPAPLLETMLGDTDNPLIINRLLYVPSMKEDQASVALSRLLEGHRSLDVQIMPLDEYGTSPLPWLTQQIYSSKFIIMHFTPSEAYLADLSNRRVSLLAGLAVGMGRQVRLVMKANDPVALDYRDLRISYTNSRMLKERCSDWLGTLQIESGSRQVVHKHLPSELAALRFGNHVAEADAAGLDTYFVETRDFLDVIEGTATIFTGRKGTGKTASMLQAASQLKTDLRNVVCVIKPASYELEALCDLLGRISVSHIGDYLIEGVWKYLLYTEVASTLVRETEGTPAGVRDGSEIDRLRKSLEASHHGLQATFSARLEDLIKNLDFDLSETLKNRGVQETRQIIGRALYGSHIRKIQKLLADALRGKRRVAILIDNLDKAWERGADLATMSSVIFGLLTAVGRISDEHSREVEDDSKSTRFTLTAFLRSDIYAYVRSHAREPDKISSSEIEWRDLDLLARVLEDRFMAARDDKSAPSDLWSQYFKPTMHGVPSRDYILSRIQPRPRDLVFFANAAVVQASNSRHSMIDISDVEKAEIAYSEFAYEALLVEGIAVGIDMEGLLMTFVGEQSLLTQVEILALLTEGGFIEGQLQSIHILRQHGFLGIETSPLVFDFGGTVGEMRKADVLSKKLQKVSKRPCSYQIHPAYRSHLLIDDPDSNS